MSKKKASFIFSIFCVDKPPKKSFQSFQKYQSSKHHFRQSSKQRLKTILHGADGDVGRRGGGIEASVTGTKRHRDPFPKKTPQRFGFFLLGRIYVFFVGSRCFLMFFGWKFPEKFQDYWRLWLERCFFVSRKFKRGWFSGSMHYDVFLNLPVDGTYSKMRCRSCSCWTPRLFQSIQSTSVFIRRMEGCTMSWNYMFTLLLLRISGFRPAINLCNIILVTLSSLVYLQLRLPKFLFQILD